MRRGPVAAKEDLHGGFGFPIRLGGEVLGVVEFFSHARQRPDTNLLATMAAIGNHIGQFIHRKRGGARRTGVAFRRARQPRMYARRCSRSRSFHGFGPAGRPPLPRAFSLG